MRTLIAAQGDGEGVPGVHPFCAGLGAALYQGGEGFIRVVDIGEGWHQ